MKIAFWAWLIGAVVYLIYQLKDDQSDLSADERVPMIFMPVIAALWFFTAPVQLSTKWKLKKMKEKRDQS